MLHQKVKWSLIIVGLLFINRSYPTKAISSAKCYRDTLIWVNLAGPLEFKFVFNMIFFNSWLIQGIGNKLLWLCQIYANAVLLLRLPHHVHQENLPQNTLWVLTMKQNGVQGTRISKANHSKFKLRLISYRCFPFWDMFIFIDMSCQSILINWFEMMIPPRWYEILAELGNKHHFMSECCVRECWYHSSNWKGLYLLAKVNCLDESCACSNTKSDMVHK